MPQRVRLFLAGSFTAVRQALFDFRSAGGKLIVTNVGTSAFRSVEIRYKLRRDKETLLGGLSYRVRVGTLGPGESRTVAAGHYDPDNCTIVFVKVT